MAEYDTTIRIGTQADLSGGVQTEKQLEQITRKAKELGKASSESAGKASNAFGRLQQATGRLRQALTGFGVAGIFSALISQIGKVAASFDAAKKRAEDFAKIQKQLAESKGVQQLASDYERLKDAVSAASAEQSHALDMIDEDVKNRRRLEKAQRDAAKQNELAALDPSDPAYAQKVAQINARYAIGESAEAASNAREDVVLQRQRLETQAGLKDQKAAAQDAQTTLIRRKIADAQREKNRADMASQSLNENDKTGVLSAIGTTMSQLFTGDWGRLTEAKTKEGDAERKTEAEKAAAAELKIADLQEELRKSEERAAALRKEAGNLRERRDKAGEALTAIDIERNTASISGRTVLAAADTALGKKEAQIARDEDIIAAGPGRVAAIKAKIAAAEQQKQSAIDANTKEQQDAEMARLALDRFNAAGHRRNGTGVQAQRSALEEDVDRETAEATQSRVRLQSTLATLAETIKGLNADLKKVEREVDAATRRQNTVNAEVSGS